MVPNGWKRIALDNLAKTVTSGSRDWAQYYSQEGSKFIRMTNLQRDSIHLNLNDLKYVDVQSNSADGKRTSLKSGDILISITAELGKIGWVPEGLGEAFINQHIALVRLSPEKANSLFVAYLLSSSRMNKQINKLNDSGAKAGLNLPTIRRLHLPTPPLPEQKKIARILSTWDKAIETVDKLIENSKQQKKALMQQLLTGKKRLPGHITSKKYIKTKYGQIPQDWEFVPINKIAIQAGLRNGHEEGIPVLSCSKYDGFVDSLKYFKKKIYSDDLSNYKVILRGELGFPSNHIEEGSIGIQNKYDKGLVSPIYTVFKPKNNINCNYLYQLLKTDHYKQIFSAQTNASVDRRGSLRWKEFGLIKVPLPSLGEQSAIANVVIKAEEVTHALILQAENLREQKQALMQQLLTGKRRVKIDDDRSLAQAG